MTTTPEWPAFDDTVLRAMAKWPDVPQCFGWLALDRRGNWRIRGELIGHARARAFLDRHYRADEAGRWYVQNGPQQVFVDLEYTPWVYRYDVHQGFTTHTGMRGNELTAVHLDDEGNLLLVTHLGVGVVDDRDLTACAALFEPTFDEAGPRSLRWRGQLLPVRPLARAQVGAEFGFEAQPRGRESAHEV